MLAEITEIGKSDNRRHFRIVTKVPIDYESELIGHEDIAQLIADKHHYLERGRNPEFPNTWFLHVTES